MQGPKEVSEVNCHVTTRRRLQQSGTKLPPSRPRGPRLAQPPCHRGAPPRNAATSVRPEQRRERPCSRTDDDIGNMNRPVASGEKTDHVRTPPRRPPAGRDPDEQI